MIKLIKPSISFDSVEHELKEIFKSGQFTQGKNVEIFENSLKKYLNVEYIGLTTSATTALSLSLRVMGIKQGDKVAVSDYSWPASSNVIEEIGATPIFIDVNPETFNMCPKDLTKKINSDVSAVIFVDTFGNPSGIEEINKICKKYKIPILEDAACALGSEINEIKVGAYSDITCFSFHPRKVLNTGEGGAIATNNKDYSDLFKVKLAAGASRKAEVGLDFTDYGFNFRMTEIQALMGWKQLLELDNYVEKRKLIKEEYISQLKGHDFIPQKINKNVYHNCQSIVFKVPENLSRNELVNYLFKKNIESTLGTYCLSGTKFNQQKYDDVQKNSSYIDSIAITLPCYSGIDTLKVTDEIISFIS
jgi:perosamine synthetase